MINNIEEAITIAKVECTDEYAVAYLEAINVSIQYGRQIGREKDAFEVQLLYAYSNMDGWEGTKAEEVKAFFKEYLKDRLGDAYYETEDEASEDLT
jgi:hypothetical protein